METLNSVRASHRSVHLTDTTAKLLYEQLMCGLVELVASNAIVKFYFSVVFSMALIPTTLPEQSQAAHLLHGRRKKM